MRRAVWARDAGRCTWPLDGGCCCGSTHRLELDHVIPWAAWGPSTVENLRVVCGRHNALAARQVFGGLRMKRYGRGSTGSANDLFASELAGGRLSFDFRLRPGVVTRSNALELMRSVGLDVPLG